VNLSFGGALANWAAANLLSDETGAANPHRYNSGGWQSSSAGGVIYQLGSINLDNYNYAGLVGPYLYSLDQYAAIGSQPPHSNYYIILGAMSGLVGLYLDATPGNTLTVVVKG
jgi:hypothetical protein